MLNTIFTSELCYHSVTYYLLMRLSNPLHDQLTLIRWFKSSRCQRKRSERPKFNNRWSESTRNWWRPPNRYALAQIFHKLAQWIASRLRETKSSCITIHSFQSTVKFVSLSYEIALVSIPALKQRAKKEKTPPPPPKTITVMAGITRLCSYENWLLFCLPLWATNSWILKMLYNNDVEFRPFRRPPLRRAPPPWQFSSATMQ